MNKLLLTLAGCGLSLVLFFAITLVANASLRSARLDLTEDKVFTLNEGSKSVARGIDEPINLYFYFSRTLARVKVPGIVDYADRVLGMLKEYERASSGKIRLSVIDPEPFSVEEEKAVEQGLQGAQPDQNSDPLYFGLVGTSAMEAHEVIPFFSLDEAKQRTLEYDLSKLIWTLAHPDKHKVGILSALPLEGSGGMPMMGQQGAPPWKLLEEMKAYFEYEVVPTGSEELPADLDVLMVLQPRAFPESALYLIDQWALAGKPLLVFVDPQCDVDQGDADPSNPMSRFGAAKDSNLEPLFKAWGIELVKQMVVGDKLLGERRVVQSQGSRGGQVEIPIVFYLGLTEAEMNKDDPITRLLTNVAVWTPGSLRKLPEGTTTFTPLMQTSDQAQEIPASRFQFMPDAQELLATFVPGYEKLTLAARVTGNVSSAFPGGKPGAEPTPEGMPPAAGLTASSAPLNVVVFSDADLLHERLWTQEVARMGGRSFYAISAENMDLVRNTIESLTGGQELMSIRSRGRTSRPFERVQAIQQAADQRFLAEEQEFQNKLKDAKQRLQELQGARGEGAAEMVTAAQREEEAQLKEEIIATNRALRDVQHNMRKDIDGLGARIKWLNILTMPALVSLVAIALGLWNGYHRSNK